jgi:hypothetical protein
MEANDRFRHWVYEDDLENTSEQLASPGASSTAGAPGEPGASTESNASILASILGTSTASAASILGAGTGAGVGVGASAATASILESIIAGAGAGVGVSAGSAEISYPSYNYSGCGGDMSWRPPNPVVNLNDYRTSMRPILETHINDEIIGSESIGSESIGSESIGSESICTLNSPSQCWSVPVAAVRPSAIRTPVERPIERRMSAPAIAPMASQTSVWDRIPQSNPDVGTSNAYKMCKYKYNKSNSYNGVIKTQTHYNNNPTANLQNRYEYLSLSDILKYVTCGGVLCDSYMDEFTSYVLSELNKSSKVEMYLDKVSRIDGGVYEKEKPMISWGDYALCGKLCLEWVLCNPEKLGRG